jgi:hypothetical protein
MSFNPLLKQSHAAIIGNEHADALAKNSATTYADNADTSIRTSEPTCSSFPFSAEQ